MTRARPLQRGHARTSSRKVRRRSFGDDWPRVEAAVYERVARKLGDGPVVIPFTANLAVGTRH